MTRGFLSRLAMFLFGQSLSAAGSALMVAIGLGADAYNVMIQGLSGVAHIRHGTMSSVMLFLLLLPALRRGRSRIGPGTVISIFLVGGVVNLVQPVFAPLRFAPLVVRLLLVPLIPLVIGAGIALVQAADLGMASNDILPLLLFEHQKRLQYRTVRILYDAAQCALGLCLGGVVGVCTVASLLLTGPAIQAVLSMLRRCSRVLRAEGDSAARSS